MNPIPPTAVRRRAPPSRRAGSAGAVDSSEELVAFLLNPRSYPHRPRRVHLLQTHASFVFIAPPFVFKVKKPVNFGFLDFSSLEKRRHFCEREVALNRRLAPKIYLDVLPISRIQGRLTFGMGEAVVEYTVKMRRMTDGYFLDKLLGRNGVDPGDIDRIAATLKDFYQGQRPNEEIESWGRIERLRISTDENFQQTEKFVGEAAVSTDAPVGEGSAFEGVQDCPVNPTISRPAFETIRFYTNEFYKRQARLFESRVREKWIRDCHGDLHLEHVHLTPGDLSIYDCIEFNDRFRYVDVASDAAFLAMDLDYKGRPDLGRYFARRMAAELQDDGMPRLMDFYKCYRAYVRGKVESLQSIARAMPEKERLAAAERARRYFKLALQYTVAGSKPRVLVVMGRIASGKSTLARALAAKLGWPIYSSDSVRKQLAGVPLYERTRAVLRRRLYSAARTGQTYRSLFAAAEVEVHAGRSVILDATFARREHRAAVRDHFSPRGLAVVFVEAQASDIAAKRRLKARELKSNEVSDARFEDFQRLANLYDPPLELRGRRFATVCTTGSLEQTVTRALRSLVRLRLEFTCPSQRIQ